MSETKKMLRFLITPNVACPYDQRMVKELAAGFNAIGHYAAAWPAPMTAEEILKICESLSIDVVLQINRTRDPDVPWPDHIRHISWYQDVFPETLDGFADGFKAGDILYALSDPGVLGLNVSLPCFVGTLFTGVAPSVFEYRHPTGVQDIDLSLCGGLPPPVHIDLNLEADLLWLVDSLIARVPLIGRAKLLWIARKMFFGKRLPVDYVPYANLVAMANIVESCYRPLRGELDIHQLADIMSHYLAELEDVGADSGSSSVPSTPRSGMFEKILKPYAGRFAGRSDFKARLMRYLAGTSSFLQPAATSPARKAIGYFSQSYPRILDRIALVNLASKVSDSLELYGPGLSAHTFSHPYLKGVIDTQEGLLDIYSRSKINLSNNTHGLGMHSRTFECMAVGGFLFMHESPHDTKVGGMLTAFEPGVHYGSYTPENFVQEANRWLHDEEARLEVGTKARTIIQERHCWHHRAQQIIDDLSR